MALKIDGVYPQLAGQLEVNGPTRKFQQEFWVMFNELGSVADCSDIILKRNDVPSAYSTYLNDPLMVANPVIYVRDGEIPNRWIVVVTWSTISNLTEAIKDPTKRPALVSMGTYKEQEIPNVDYDNVPIVTTAGEPINHNQQKGYPSYSIRKAVYPFPSQFGVYRDFVNNDDVTIYGTTYAPYTLFCPDVNVSELSYEGPYAFHELNCNIYVNTRQTNDGDVWGWRLLLRNAGYHERNFTGYAKLKSGKPNYAKPIYVYTAIQLNVNGVPAYPSSPILLDPNGRAFRQKLPNDDANARASGFRAKDIEAGYYNTGPVIGISVPGEPATTTGITQKQWDRAVVEVRLYNLVPFNEYFPFK